MIGRAARIAAITFGTGLAAWLWPASVHFIQWTADGPSRIAIVAPPATLWWAMGVSAVAALALWRARDHLVSALAPLMLLWICAVPYLPWLPDRVPVLLVLAGPLRWVVAGVAVALAGTRLATLREWTSGAWTLPGRTTVFVVSLVLYAVLGLRSLSVVGLAGDEPQYLIITHSLMADGDLTIENNHRQRDYRSFSQAELPPDFMRRGQNGEIYSIHAPGLPALLVPAYAAAGARGAVLMMALAAALAAVAVFALGEMAGGRAVAWATWAALCLTVPFNPYAWAIFPEIAGAAIVAWAAVWLASPPATGLAAWAVRGAILALLPWLHTKFIIFLAGFTFFLLLRLRAQLTAAAALAIPVALSVAAWFASFYVIYGTPNPEAPYGTYARDWVKLENLPRGVLGLLVDQKFGLLMYAPIYVCAAAGVWIALRDRRWRGVMAALGLIAIAFVASSARLYMWWGGWSAPARFLVPVLPLLAPAIALAFVRARGTRWNTPIVVCLGVSLLVSVAGVVEAERLLLFSDAHGIARIVDRIQGSAPLAATLPTFTESDWRLSSMRPPRYSPLVREAAVARGRIALLDAFDPDRRRAFDYASGRLLSREEWLHAGTFTASIAPDATRPPMPATAIEPLAGGTGALRQGPGQAALAYVDDHAYPEGGVFWTKGTERARVLVAPGGSRALTLHVHIGPDAGTVYLRVGARAIDVPLNAHETRAIDVERLPADALWVPIAVQSSSTFRPSDVDARSGDHRLLGAQMRIELR